MRLTPLRTETSFPGRDRRTPVRRNGDYHRLRNGKVVTSGPLGADGYRKVCPLPSAAPAGPSWSETRSGRGGAAERSGGEPTARGRPPQSSEPDQAPVPTPRDTNVPAKCSADGIYNPGRSFVALSPPVSGR